MEEVQIRLTVKRTGEEVEVQYDKGTKTLFISLFDTEGRLKKRSLQKVGYNPIPTFKEALVQQLEEGDWAD